MKRMITRAPISRGQRALYEELYQAGDEGMTNRELATALSFSPYQFAGLLGALGRRIEYTDGSDQFGGIGIGLIFEIRRMDDVWRYWIRPAFKTVLEEEGIV